MLVVRAALCQSICDLNILSKGSIYFATVSEPFCIRALVSVK
jgi:hypothetical protein